jgi:hypothetical protein
MTSGVDGPWVLCRAPSTGETIVIMQSDYRHWTGVNPDNYEFIAEGKRELMKMFQKLLTL